MINKEYSNKSLNQRLRYLVSMVSIILTILFALFMLFIDIRLGLLCLGGGIIFSILTIGGFSIALKIIRRK